MKRLQNKTAIITGGASGLGKAAVHKFAAEGASVSIWDVNVEAGEKLAEELTGKGFPVEYHHVNVADYNLVADKVSEAVSHHGKIDILINNAGITSDATLIKMDESQWDEVVDVNLKGIFNCGQAVGRIMVEQGSGVIINTSSVVALYGNFGQTNYVASKAGVIGMTKVWARELGRKGVRVNAVAPGFIATDLVAKMPEKVLEMIQGKTPLGRLGTPDDIAGAYLFLASDEASFINGAVLSVDGGIVV